VWVKLPNRKYVNLAKVDEVNWQVIPETKKEPGMAWAQNTGSSSAWIKADDTVLVRIPVLPDEEAEEILNHHLKALDDLMTGKTLLWDLSTDELAG